VAVSGSRPTGSPGAVRHRITHKHGNACPGVYLWRLGGSGSGARLFADEPADGLRRGKDARVLPPLLASPILEVTGRWSLRTGFTIPFANGGTLVLIHSTDPISGLSPVRVQVGINAAVVANHHVCVRETLADGQVRLSRFTAPPTLAGLDMLSNRLSAHPGVGAVAEPTSMTWLALSTKLSELDWQRPPSAKDRSLYR